MLTPSQAAMYRRMTIGDDALMTSLFSGADRAPDALGDRTSSLVRLAALIVGRRRCAGVSAGGPERHQRGRITGADHRGAARHRTGRWLHPGDVRGAEAGARPGV